jgi:hypothetical protein
MIKACQFFGKQMVSRGATNQRQHDGRKEFASEYVAELIPSVNGQK